MNHQQLRELLGAYALDAVDASERAEIETHLPECAACVAEVAGHVRVAWALAHNATPRPDPASSPVTARRPPRALLSALVVAAVAVLGAQGVGQQRRLDRVETAMHELGAASGRVELLARAQGASVDPAAQHIALTDGAGHRVAAAVVEPNGTGFLFGGGLPILGADQTYELWRIENNSRVPAGTLGPPAPVVAFQATRDTVILAVTVEATGGAATSDHPPVAQGTVAPRSG